MAASTTEQKVAELTADKQRLEFIAAAAEEKVTEFHQDKQQLDRVVQDANAKICKLESEVEPVSELEAQIESLTAQLECAQLQLTSTTARLDEETSERIRLGARAAELAKERSELSTRADAAKVALVASRWLHLVEAAHAKDEQRGRICSMMSTLCEQRATENVQFEASKAEFLERIRVMEASRQEQEDRTQQLVVENTRLQQEGERMTEITAENERRQEECERTKELTAEIARLQQEVDRIHDIEADNARLQREGERIEELERDNNRLQQQIQKSTGADRCIQRKAQDFETCEKENKQLRERNQQLSATMQQFKQESEELLMDNRGLLESIALAEGDLEKVSDQHAQLIGHVNKKQKIRYTLNLKDERNLLRRELEKARQRLSHLEGSKRSDSLFGALASLGYAPVAVQQSPMQGAAAKSRRATMLETVAEQPGKSPPGGGQSSNGRAQAGITPRRLAGPAPSGPSKVFARDAPRLEEFQRRCRIQESALERINSDFGHMVALVERAIVGDCVPSSASAANAEHKDGAEAATFANTLQRLRKVIAQQRKAAATQAAPPLPATAGSGRADACQRPSEDGPSTPEHRKSDLRDLSEAPSPLDLSKATSALELLEGHSFENKENDDTLENHGLAEQDCLKESGQGTGDGEENEQVPASKDMTEC